MPTAGSSLADESDQLESLAALLTARAQEARNGTAASPQQHSELVQALRSASELVSEARNNLGDLMLSFVQCTALRLLLKWNVIEKIPLEGAISYAHLASRVGVDANLIT